MWACVSFLLHQVIWNYFSWEWWCKHKKPFCWINMKPHAINTRVKGFCWTLEKRKQTIRTICSVAPTMPELLSISLTPNTSSAQNDFFVFAMLGVEARTLCMLANNSTVELQPQHPNNHYQLDHVIISQRVMSPDWLVTPIWGTLD